MPADIEIRVHKSQAEFYRTEMTFVYSSQDSVITSSAEGGSPINLSGFIAARDAQEAYTKMLTDFIFPPGSQVRSLFESARDKIEDGEEAKFRLYVSSSAVELQTLRWELLGEPDNYNVISTSQKFLFSRYLYSRAFKPVRLRPKREINSLIAISGLSSSTRRRFKLDEIKTNKLPDITSQRLQAFHFDEIGANATLTIEKLFRSLTDKEYDLLYLIGHGASQPQSVFYIESEDNSNLTDTRHFFTADELVTRFGELRYLPRLIVLASCQSGKDLTAIGPRLLEAGVAAVVAMQGDVSQDTLLSFTETFFDELNRDGKVDRATAVARGAVRQHPDYWMPILFSRLREGRIWFQAGFPSRGGGQNAPNWPAIVAKAKTNGILPIVGPGLGDKVFGDLRDLAYTLLQVLRENGYLVDSDLLSDRTGLAQACQIARASVKDVDLCRRYMFEALNRQLVTYHRKKATDAQTKLIKTLDAETLQRETLELLLQVGESLRSNKRDPYRLLAELEATFFINSNHDDLLFDALVAQKKMPKRLFPRWRKSTVDDAVIIGTDARAASADDLKNATIKSPIIYHVFGHFSELDSIVLTEDDYFEYLIRTSADRALVPERIRSREVSSSLVFLGFQITDWNFRVLLHSILCQQGSAKLTNLTHVAVQLDRNDESPVAHHTRAAYLKGLLRDLAAGSEIFWGGPDDFLESLLRDVKE